MREFVQGHDVVMLSGFLFVDLFCLFVICLVFRFEQRRTSIFVEVNVRTDQPVKKFHFFAELLENSTQPLRYFEVPEDVFPLNLN